MHDEATYLGDGLYVTYDGQMFRLFTSNGIRVTNEVFLEHEVLEAFLHYISSKTNVTFSLTDAKKA